VIGDVVESLLEDPDLAANGTAVGLELRFAGARSPMPPRIRDKWVHMRLSRGSRYSKLRQLHLQLRFVAAARAAKMSRMTSVRSITRRPRCFSRFAPCTGDSPSSNITSVAPAPERHVLQLFDFALAR